MQEIWRLLCETNLGCLCRARRRTEAPDVDGRPSDTADEDELGPDSALAAATVLQERLRCGGVPILGHTHRVWLFSVLKETPCLVLPSVS